MALEQTYNKDAKTKLFAGISQSQSTISKYLKALPELTSISQQTLEMARMMKDEVQVGTGSSEKEDICITRIIKVISDRFSHPFMGQIGESLTNIATGEVASSTELALAKEKGLAALELAEQTDAAKVDPIHLKMFHEKKTKPVSKASTVKDLHHEEEDVMRSLCFAQNLDDTQKIDAFSHEWTRYPSSLFEPDKEHPCGFAMRKGNKADFLVAMKEECGEAWVECEQLPTDESRGRSTAMIVDMMAFVQRFQDMGCKDFGELQKCYLQKIIAMCPDGCQVIHIVGDRYDVSPERSLKEEERARREKETRSLKTYIPQANLPMPKWKKFIGKRENKRNLLKFLLETWSNGENDIPEGIQVTVGGFTEATVKMTNGLVQEVPSLSNPNHEEADSLIFAHAAHMVNEENIGRIVINANDTDIMVMSIYYAHQLHDLQELWVHKRTSASNVYISCHSIATHLEETFPNQNITGALMAAYILSGCDTVSYPFRIGKKRAFKTALQCIDDLGQVAAFDENNVSESTVKFAQNYFFALYGRKEFNGTLDELRCHLFMSKHGDLRSLPPTSDAFKLHLLRSLNQLVICRKASEVRPTLPDPSSFGRKIENGFLVALRMTKARKPSYVGTSCKCKKGRCRVRCQCKAAGVKCSIACSCRGDPSLCALAQPD